MELIDTNIQRTQFGLIPIDWDIVQLKEIIKEFIVPMRDKPKNLSGDIPWCRIEDCDGKYLYASKSHQAVDLATIQAMNLKVNPENTLLVSCSADLGRCAIVKNPLITNQTFIGLVTNNKVNEEFLFYIMTKSAPRLNMLSSGTTISYLSREQFEEFKIPLPPTLTEQKAIATALSDVDSLISSLDKLITKKKAIKHGAMQELLTPPHQGGKRLPGFSGDWEEKLLGELTELITKGTTPTSIGKEFTNQGISFIKAESIDKTGNIINNKVTFIDAETHDLLGRSKMKKDDILFTIAGVLGRIGVIQENNLPANTNQAVAIVRLKKTLNLFVPFFFHILRTKEIEKHIESISVQGAQANFSLTDVSNIPLSIPVNSEEQKAIAQILSDMDKEIESLENKKTKYQEIKQGMMQELLTGKTRLFWN